MYYVKIENNQAVSASHEFPGNGYNPEEYQYRWDWEALEQAEEIADQLTENTDKRFIALDNGPCHSPRFDITTVPVIGEKVSYAFNGDSYPDGEVVSISKTLKKITTSTGNSYYRVKQTGCWKRNGTWSLVGGHRYEQNPHF